MIAMIIISILLSIFSTTVMSYIAMATPIGPWIAPTVILCALLVYPYWYQGKILQYALTYTVTCASVGGILATAYGFTFPTLYFLDAVYFNQLLAQPVYFCGICTVFAGIAGWYGMWMAQCMQRMILTQENIPFPIAQLMHKMIVAQRELKKAYELAAGFVITSLFCILQDGIGFIVGIIPKTVIFCSSMQCTYLSLPVMGFDLWPMLWAIGFVTGYVIVMPLLIGSLSLLFFVRPMHDLFFFNMSQTDFTVAFCSGIVVSGALLACIPKHIMHRWHILYAYIIDARRLPWSNRISICDKSIIYEGILLFPCLITILWYAGFSLLEQCYLLLAIVVCTYQIIMIAGKIGLAQLGRFATFVLLPALCIWNLDALRITVIVLFVEVAAGVAVDVLCGKKMAASVGADLHKVSWYQYLGLLVSSLVIGVIFWLLITHLGLGSPELFAQRAQTRALLVHAKQFDMFVLVLGILFGFALKYVRLNPMLVLGGILMPLNLSLGLVFGGLLACVSSDAQRWFALWSGVFAANSLWMVIKGVM